MQEDTIVIDRVKYSMDNLVGLLAELAAYKAAEKSNDSTLVFHVELSPHSNFHPIPFWIGGVLYKSAEYYIQYRKALLFGDSATANKILRSDAVIDTKRLS